MLSLRHLTLVQFKNYDQRSFTFTERITGICGRNGAGKTNLLDAIYYLCFTRSYFSRQDALHASHGKSGFRIEGDFLLNDKPEKAICILRETGRKEFSINDQLYERFSEHIGHYPCVIITPDDAELLTGQSEERRRFIDSVLSQLDPEYLKNLIRYNKILLQRNSLLKAFAEGTHRDDQLLDVLDEQLCNSGQYVFDKRKEWMVGFLPMVKHVYYEIAGADTSREEVNLFYESELLLADFPALLKANRQKDTYTQRTSSGIHRDDIDMRLGSYSFKNLASQGQRKSLLFALKLAEMELLQKEKHFPPLLLLDDVFEKLDEERIRNLLQRVCEENEGQVFITDTNKDRLEQYLGKLESGFQLIEI